MQDALASFVGLDAGTTNTRAWRVVGGKIVGRARASVGVRDVAIAGSGEVLRSAVEGLVRELTDSPDEVGPRPRYVVAAGMITSELGLAEVPHVAAPAGVAELAAGIRSRRLRGDDGLELLLVPGVRSGPTRLRKDEIALADVMRGEETLCLGLHDVGLLGSGGTLLNLGSHWKTVHLDPSGRVAGSSTSLSGELLHAAQTRTVLARSVPAERPDHLHADWVRAGAAETRRSGLARALFCVRLLEQRTPSVPEERMSYLVGAFVGAEVETIVRRRVGDSPVVLAGGGPIADAFASALAEEGCEARVLTPAEVEEGMVRGLGLVASARIRRDP